MASYPLAFQNSTHGDLGGEGALSLWGALGFPATRMALAGTELWQLFPLRWLSPTQGMSCWGRHSGCSAAARARAVLPGWG